MRDAWPAAPIRRFALTSAYVFRRPYGLRAMRARSHPNERRAPGEAAAHTFEQHVLTFLDPAVAHRHVERKWNRRGRRIAVLVDRYDHAFSRQAELARRAGHDPDIGLMRNQPIDLRCLHARLRECFVRDFFEHVDRELE